MNTKLYDKEKEWLKTSPRNEYAALYGVGGELRLTKEGGERNVRFFGEEIETYFRTPNVLTHWHPGESAIEIYGHEDAPFSVTDISMGIEHHKEIRALTPKSLHRFVFCALTKVQKRDMQLALDFESTLVNPKDTAAIERFWARFARKWNCTYEKISLDKLT